MKQKAYALSEGERRAATRAALAGLESGELNEPPERKRAIYGITGLELVWPTPAQLIAAIESVAPVLAELGVPQPCVQAIEHIARLADSGELGFEMSVDMPALAKTLLPVESVDAWVVGYVALRVFSYPDAALPGDTGVPAALAGGAGAPTRLPADAGAAAALSGDADAPAPWAADAGMPAPLRSDAGAALFSDVAGTVVSSADERAAAIEACKPWRSYATVALLNALEAHGDTLE